MVVTSTGTVASSAWGWAALAAGTMARGPRHRGRRSAAGRPRARPPARHPSSAADPRSHGRRAGRGGPRPETAVAGVEEEGGTVRDEPRDQQRKAQAQVDAVAIPQIPGKPLGDAFRGPPASRGRADGLRADGLRHLENPAIVG